MPPYAAADFEATLQAIWDGTQDHGLGTTATIVNYWYHTLDERCLEVLLAMPVSPRHASIVAKMCTRPGHCNRNTLALLLRYALHVQGQTEARRVLHTCSSATQFVPDQACVAMQTMARVVAYVNSATAVRDCFDTYMDCCSPSYPFTVRSCAAALACLMVEVPHSDSFHDIASLAPRCHSALELLGKMEDAWLPIADKAILVAHHLMTTTLTREDLDMLGRIAQRWPDEAVDNAVLVPLVANNRPLPQALFADLWLDTRVRNEQHLLVYLVKYGVPPDNGAPFLANVLKYSSVDTRGVYVQELSAGRTPLSLPSAHGAFDEAHTGVTQFVCSDGTTDILTAHLVRCCLYFKGEMSRVPVLQTIAKECTIDTLEAFRHMLYYDHLPDAAPLIQLASFCDVMCNTRHMCMAIQALAAEDFWAAYDLAKDWPGTRPFLARAAWEQLHSLAKCSRMGEVADMVAGV